jgi:hypothetical protein
MKRLLFATVLATGLGLAGGSATRAKPADLPSNNQIECPINCDDPTRTSGIAVGVIEFPKCDPGQPMSIDACLPGFVSAYLQHLFGQPVNGSDQTLQPTEARLLDEIRLRNEQAPLWQALRTLSRASGVTVTADQDRLRDASVDLDTPVTLKSDCTTLHKALRQLTVDLDLRYVVEDGIVKITTKEPWNKCQTPEEQTAQTRVQKSEELFERGERCRQAGNYGPARNWYQAARSLAPRSLYGRVADMRLADMDERLRDDAEEQTAPERPMAPEAGLRRLRDGTVPLGLVEISY